MADIYSAAALYSDVLDALTRARSTMLSPAWQSSMGNQPQAVRVAAARELSQLQSAINALSNKSLSDVADKLQANEGPLRESVAGLDEAIRTLTNVQRLLSTVTQVIGVAEKILGPTRKVLETIKKFKSIHLIELSSLCEIDEPELQGIVRDLEQKNLVKVDRSPDDYIVTAREAAFRTA